MECLSDDIGDFYDFHRCSLCELWNWFSSTLALHSFWVSTSCWEVVSFFVMLDVDAALDGHRHGRWHVEKYGSKYVACSTRRCVSSRVTGDAQNMFHSSFALERSRGTLLDLLFNWSKLDIFLPRRCAPRSWSWECLAWQNGLCLRRLQLSASRTFVTTRYGTNSTCDTFFLSGYVTMCMRRRTSRSSRTPSRVSPSTFSSCSATRTSRRRATRRQSARTCTAHSTSPCQIISRGLLSLTSWSVQIRDDSWTFCALTVVQLMNWTTDRTIPLTYLRSWITSVNIFPSLNIKKRKSTHEFFCSIECNRSEKKNRQICWHISFTWEILCWFHPDLIRIFGKTMDGWHNMNYVDHIQNWSHQQWTSHTKRWVHRV